MPEKYLTVNMAATVIKPLQAITLFFYSTIIGTSLVAIVLYFVRDIADLEIRGENIKEIALIASIIIAGICFFLANRLYQKGVAEAKSYGMPAKEKIAKYLAAFMKYMLSCEVGAMISFIAFFVTGNEYCIIPGVVMVACMFLKRPSRARIFNELEMDTKEQMEVN